MRFIYLYILALILVFGMTLYINVFSCKESMFGEGPMGNIDTNLGSVLFESDPLLKESKVPKTGKKIAVNSRVKPLTNKEKEVVVDETQEAGIVKVEEEKNYKILNYNTLDPLANFTEVKSNLPMFEVAQYTSNKDTNKKDTAYVCMNNNWEKGKKNKDNIKSGWTKDPLKDKMCVGFYNEKKNPKKWNILISCKKNDCNSKLGLNPLNSKLENFPLNGETIWPSYPVDNIDEVYKLYVDSASDKITKETRNNLMYRFEEKEEVKGVKALDIKTNEDISIIINNCGIKNYKSQNDEPCLGVIKEKDTYKYIFKSDDENEKKDYKVGKNDIEKIWILNKKYI